MLSVRQRVGEGSYVGIDKTEKINIETYWLSF